jgi:hypothetical protein
VCTAGNARIAGIAQKKCKGLVLYAFLLTTGTQSLTKWYCCRYGNDVRSPAYVTPNKCPIIGALGVQIKVNEFCYSWLTCS